MTLMWKLALVHQGKGTDALLNSYEQERHEVAKETIRKVSKATKVVTLTNPISRALRNQLASILINFDVVQQQLGRAVGMLDISYQNSPAVREDMANRKSTGPNKGDRATNVLFQDEKGQPHSLVNYFRGTEHVLFLFMGLCDAKPSPELKQIQDRISKDYAGLIRSYLVAGTPVASSDWSGPVIVSIDGAIHRRYGADKEGALYLIRPDHHIAFRSQPVDVGLFFDYLSGHLVPTLSYV
eukprot:4878308-Ditylum_brightwellii.AAC.1